jgi:hypothetical protein
VFTRDSYEDWRGIEVVDDAGRRIGEVLEVFLDADTDAPEWVMLDVGRGAALDPGDGPAVARLVPLAGLTFAETALVSRWDADKVAGSPVDGAVDGISRADEDRLYRHYGLDYPTHWVNDGMPGGAETVGVAGIASEGQHPSGIAGRSPDASSSESEVDEPRRVRPATQIDRPDPAGPTS